MNIKYKCKNNIERLTLALELQKLGWSLENIYWGLVYEDSDFNASSYINIDNESDETGYVYFLSEGQEEEDGLSPIKEVRYKKDILIKCEEYNPIKIKLNNSYKAIVYSDNIKVGCQTFTFDKIEELYKAVQKMKENK